MIQTSKTVAKRQIRVVSLFWRANQYSRISGLTVRQRNAARRRTCGKRPRQVDSGCRGCRLVLAPFLRMIMAQPPRSVTLLARSQARSGDAEADGFEQPLVAPAVHPFTGTFAASEHTVAFGSKAFRSAFPLHVVALACRFSSRWPPL